MITDSLIRFHYQQHGVKGNPTLLLLHGFMGSSDDWDTRFINEVVDSGFQLLAVDLPGHGRTVVDKEESYTFENCASAIVELLDDDGWKLLWTPPSLPYYELEGPFKNCLLARVQKSLMLKNLLRRALEKWVTKWVSRHLIPSCY